MRQIRRWQPIVVIVILTAWVAYASGQVTIIPTAGGATLGANTFTGTQTFTGWILSSTAFSATGGTDGPEFVKTTSPQLRYSADTNTGIDWPTGDIVNVYTNGAIVAGWNAVGPRLGTKLWASPTAPTISAGGCTSPAVSSHNGSVAYKVTIGTSCTGVTTFTLSLPTAAVGWVCTAEDMTTPATYRPSMSAHTTTTAVITNYNRTTGIAADFVAAEVIVGMCAAL